MKHRVLLLGLGFWGSRWLKLIMESPRCELAGMVGRSEEIAELSATYSIDKAIAFTDFCVGIANTEADIAIVVLPGNLHIEADHLALRKGMHVITEKPLAMNMEEAERLLQVKSQNHPEQKMMASQNYRWRPHNLTIKQAIESGKIGKVESILYEFRQQEDLQGFRGSLDNPLLEDMSIHHFDLIRFFTGSDCAHVTALSWRPTWSLFSGKSNTEAIIVMENGTVVNYTASWAARGRETSWDGSLVITGEKGCITLDANDVVRHYPHEKADTVVLEVSEQSGVILPNVEMSLTEMAYGLDYFLCCVERNEIPETTIEDNIKSYAMVVACLESATSGTTVTL
ncbi:MAG: Gfo/Idh/MocA family oxidoreductase [Oscillospiraceae bacterium]|nr:Gfo/Idh/MocA family oxidoreductase [Oscillospiraceae bacterium]